MTKNIKKDRNAVATNKKNEAIEKTLRKFGFKAVEDPKELERIKIEKAEIVKDVNPVIKVLDKLSKESSEKRICRI